MPTIGFAVTKEVQFRGALQPFTNVYYYKSPGPGPVPASAIDQVRDEVVAIERDLHSTEVNFTFYRGWLHTGDRQTSVMIKQGALSGTGNQGAAAAMDRERAFLMQWPAGLSVRNKPVYLRKWFHSCGACAGVGVLNGHLQNTTALSEGNRDTISTRMNDLRIIGPLDEWLLVAKSGREHTGPGRVHKWLEHHQLGDQWR